MTQHLVRPPIAWVDGRTHSATILTLRPTGPGSDAEPPVLEPLTRESALAITLAAALRYLAAKPVLDLPSPA
jgi:hypothetical protein